MKILTTFIVASVMLLTTACDIVDIPLQDSSRPIGTKNVLLEDYTGHTCGNCPEAADIAKQLQNEYGEDRVIIIGVHAGPFATPQLPDYPADFRTTEGTELDNTFKISRAGNPNGLVNRVKFNGKFIQSKDNWPVATFVELNKMATVDIDVQHEFNKNSKRIDASITVNYLQEGASDYHVVALLLESGVVSDQTDYRFTPSHIEEYEFEHILRATFNGTWGTQLSKNIVGSGESISKDLSYTFPAGSTWDPEHCDVVVYVYRYTSDPQQREVLQVTKKKLVD